MKTYEVKFVVSEELDGELFKHSSYHEFNAKNKILAEKAANKYGKSVLIGIHGFKSSKLESIRVAKPVVYSLEVLV